MLGYETIMSRLPKSILENLGLMIASSPLKNKLLTDEN